MNTTSVKAFGTEAKDKDLQLMQIERREVHLQILKSISCTAEFAIATFILQETTGVELNILLFRDMRSLAELQK